MRVAVVEDESAAVIQSSPVASTKASEETGKGMLRDEREVPRRRRSEPEAVAK